MNNFTIYILTHGRPHDQLTVQTLKRLGCTKEWFLVLDNQDETIQEYIDTWGADRIIVFDKNLVMARTDTGLKEPVPKFAVFARNAIECIASNRFDRTFLMLDDDITNIRARVLEGDSLKSVQLDGVFDEVIDAACQYVIDADIQCMGLGFCNLYMGGKVSFETENPRQRLCAEAFLRNGAHFVKWRLNMVEDLITSIDGSQRGATWFQFLPLQVDIRMSEGVVEGGNSDAYREFGKYRIGFMPVIAYPSCNAVKYSKGRWATTTTPSNSVPKIISGRYKKGDMYEPFV